MTALHLSSTAPSWRRSWPRDPTLAGYRVERGPAGTAVETELPTRYLG
jgi:hypothetical protein